MFGTLGGPELLLILVIALIVFGPRKLPEIGKSIGKMMAEFRRASNDFQRTIEEEVEADKMRNVLEPPRVEEPPPPSESAAPDGALARDAAAPATDEAAPATDDPPQDAPTAAPEPVPATESK